MKNKIQQKIYAIWQTLKTYASKLRISSFVGGQFKKRQERSETIELKYYKTKLGFVPFNPKSFNEDFETIERVLKTDYYKYKTKDIANEYEKVEILKNILLINHCSKTTFETFKNYKNGIKKRPD